MPIVDPGPFWKVDFSLDHAMTEFFTQPRCSAAGAVGVL